MSNSEVSLSSQNDVGRADIGWVMMSEREVNRVKVLAQVDARATSAVFLAAFVAGHHKRSKGRDALGVVQPTECRWR